MPQGVTEWTSGFITNHVTEVNKENGKTEHSFFFTAGLKTFRLSRLTDPKDYHVLSSLKKFSSVKLDTSKLPAGRGAGITNIQVKNVFVPPQEAMEITTLEHILRGNFGGTVYHALYNPRYNQTNSRIGSLFGKVDVIYPEGRIITVFQLSASPVNCLVREEKWTPLGYIPWPNRTPLGMGCPGYDDNIQVGSYVSFDTALYRGKIVPNRVTLAIVLNAEGNERYSNQKVTPTNPNSEITNRLLPALRSIKTLQRQHWGSLMDHADKILPPTMLVTDNFVIHQNRGKDLSIKSLSTFFNECLEKKKVGSPLTFDSLFSENELSGSMTDIAIMVETSDTTQQLVSQLLTECLDNESRGCLDQKRKQVVKYVYVTVSFGKTINAGNIYEMGGDSFMSKGQNPYLADVVFLDKETYMQAHSIIYMHPQQHYEQSYLTDPAYRGMLVLETYQDGTEKDKDFTTLHTVRSGKEMILDRNFDNRILAFRFIVNTTNENALKHIIEEYNLTVLQDFPPPYRTGTEHLKRFRYGTISASILSSEGVDKLIAEFNTGGDFYLMRQADQQGKDPNKSYFSTEMRKASKQDEGRAAVIALGQNEHKVNITFFPVAGSMNKFWGVIDKVLTREQVNSMLQKTNKIQSGDRKGPLKTFMSFAMQRKTTFLENMGGRDQIYEHSHTQRRSNTASIAITGWPLQVEPQQVQEIFKYWGVEIDLKTTSIGWFFGAEAEGFTLKIETSNLSKARELLNLRDKIDFDLGIGELTAMQQSHLRLIATTPRNKEVTQTRFPKPRTHKILSDTQVMEIQRCAQNLSNNSQRSEGGKTILGKEVSEAPNNPSKESEGWEDCKSKNKRKNTQSTPPPKATHDQEEISKNPYGSLVGQEQDSSEEDASMEEEQESKEQEGTEEKTSKKKSKRKVAAEQEQKEKQAIHNNFKDLKKQLTNLQLWGRGETSTMVEAYVGRITELGYEVANDQLTHLLTLTKEEIVKEVASSITSGVTPGTQKETITENKVSQTVEPTQNAPTTQISEEESKVEVSTVTPTLATNAESVTTDATADQVNGVQEGEGTVLHNEETAPLPTEPPDVQEGNPPGPGIGSPTEEKELSSPGNNKTTITDFFSKIPVASTPPQ